MSAIRPTNPNASRLRRDATEVEKRIWQSVQNRQLGGYKIRRQATIGPFVVDFLCAEHRLIVELDGGQHGDPQDLRRTAFLESRGYRVMRFWNNEAVENEQGVLQSVLDQLTALSAAHRPSPNPLPQAGEG